MLELPLMAAGEILYIGIPRATFGRELDGELPWKQFFDRLAGAADPTLVRIRALDLENAALQFVITDLLVHELRTPAAEFTLAAEAMARTLKTHGTEEQRELVQSLLRSAADFLEMANVVLDPLRRDERRLVPLREVIEHVERFYNPRLPIAKIELRRGAIEEHWSVRVPFHLAYVVLLSLIRNSKEAIVGESGRIHLRAEERPEAILLHVDDNGSGVRQEDRDKLFVKGHTRKADGRGRGLSLARWALRLHNADLHLAEATDTPVDISTRFTLTFPKEQS
jgi:signal transduction histidine kinase